MKKKNIQQFFLHFIYVIFSLCATFLVTSFTLLSSSKEKLLLKYTYPFLSIEQAIKRALLIYLNGPKAADLKFPLTLGTQG